MKDKILVIGDVFTDVCYELASTFKPNYEGFSKCREMKQVKTRAGGAYNVYSSLINLGHEMRLYSGQPIEIKHRIYFKGAPHIRYDALKDYNHTERDIDFGEFTDIVIVDYNKGSIGDREFGLLAEQVGHAQFWIHSKYDTQKYAAFNGVLFTNGREAVNIKEWPNLVVRTMGERGADLLLKGSVLAHANSTNSDPVSVINAGDIVQAAFVDACVKGGSFENALEWSQRVVGEALKSQYLAEVPKDFPSWEANYGGRKSV